MKKICILMLVLAFCFSLAVPVFAQRLADDECNTAVMCGEYSVQAKSYGYSYSDADQQESFNFLKNLGISFAIGLVFALIVTGIMRAQLKSVHAQRDASDYVKPGSLNVTRRQDLFLYREIRRIEKPKNNDGPRGGR